MLFVALGVTARDSCVVCCSYVVMMMSVVGVDGSRDVVCWW